MSFLDEYISPNDNSTFVGVPLVAAVFGKRKLSAAAEQPEIEDDTRFLRKFGAMQPTDLKRGLAPRIQSFFAALSEDLAQKRITLAEELPVLELVARHYAPAWLMIADLWRESADPEAPTRMIEALTRYLETSTPGIDQRAAWDRIALIYRQQGDWAGFVNAQVQIAELPDANLGVISAAVNTFNSVGHNLDAETRKSYAQRLAKVLEPKIADGDSTDCSRLAWLLIRCDKEDRAIEIVERGLKLDPDNEYCQNLRLKIWRRRAEAAREVNDMVAFIEASIHLVEVSASHFHELSDVANTFNQFGRELEPDPDRRHLLALRLARALESRIESGDATDCSRLGWVWMNAGEPARARKIVDMGLQLDPENEHCQKLRARIG